jgi:hypothetical protein
MQIARRQRTLRHNKECIALGPKRALDFQNSNSPAILID